MVVLKNSTCLKYLALSRHNHSWHGCLSISRTYVQDDISSFYVLLFR